MSTGAKWEGKKVNAFSDLKVMMPAHVWEYLMGWCKAADSEVSGLMLVDFDEKEKALKVGNIYLPKQECDSTSTDLDDDAIALLQQKLHKEGINLKSLRGWWHTHYNFSVFWSGKDTETISKLMSGNEWFLSIVVNHDEDFKARLDIAAPFNITIDDLDIVVTGQTEDLSKFKKDIDAQVSKKVYAQTTHYWPGPHYGHNQASAYTPGFNYWTAGIGYHDGKGNTPYGKVADVLVRNAATKAGEKKYDGRWWTRWQPEVWHGFKTGKASAEKAGDATLVRAEGQSEADFEAELAAERQFEAEEMARIQGALDEDDPMLLRLDDGGY